MTRYRAIYRNGKLLAEYSGDDLIFLAEDYQAPKVSDHAAPMVLRDIEPYRNMIDGKMITSRSQHRNLLRDHGCVEIGNEIPKTPAIKPPDPEKRRETLHRQLSDMSDRQAEKLLKGLKKEIRP